MPSTDFFKVTSNTAQLVLRETLTQLVEKDRRSEYGLTISAASTLKKFLSLSFCFILTVTL